MTGPQFVRLALCLGLAGAAVPTLGAGPATASDYQVAPDAPLVVERDLTWDITRPQAPAPTPTAEPTLEIPDTLGPTTDDEDDDGLGGGAAAGLGIAAAALVAGGVLLRRFGRN
jgi:hypothetical protein